MFFTIGYFSKLLTKLHQIWHIALAVIIMFNDVA